MADINAIDAARTVARTELTAFTWQDLSVRLTAKGEHIRHILLHSAGTAYNGRVLAILGPSGAGKTTLLHTLGGRLEASSKLQVSGSIEPAPTRPAAFIHQDDAFHGRLTVLEALHFAAALRLPASEAGAHVADVLVAYGLADIKSSIVGSAKVRGISGGEKKRLAIACALLSSDTLAPIFADEPTSGLDAFQARRVTATLREAALNKGVGRPVVLSVHQPSAHLLENFDDLLLLGDGGVTLYYGKRDQMLAVLQQNAGGSLPPELHTSLNGDLRLSPAEWALEVASVNPGNVDESKRRVAVLADAWRASRCTALDATTILHTCTRLDLLRAATAMSGQEDTSPVASQAAQGVRRSSWLVQLRWCTWRAWRQVAASRALLAMRAFGMCTTGLAFGCIWLQLAADHSSIKARVGLLQVLCNFVGVTAAMRAVRTLQDGEFVAVRRERAAGALRLAPYFLGKVGAELPVSVALPALLVAVVHPMASLAAPIASLALFLALETIAASALGIFASAVAPNLDVGLEGTKALTTLMTVFGGMYFDASTLPWPIRWLPRASIVRVTWDGLLTVEAHALAQRGIVPSAAALLAEHGVRTAVAGAGEAPPMAVSRWGRAMRRSSSSSGAPLGLDAPSDGLRMLGGDFALELLRISAFLLLAAYLAFAWKAPRFHTLRPKRD